MHGELARERVASAIRRTRLFEHSRIATDTQWMPARVYKISSIVKDPNQASLRAKQLNCDECANCGVCELIYSYSLLCSCWFN